MKQYILLISIALLSLSSKAQSDFFNIDTIQKIELFFSQSNWDYQMDTAILGAAGYTMADSVRINGIVFDSVGVKYKGNSSYDSTYQKNPLHISVNQYKPQTYHGVKNIKLSNEYADPSIIREVLSYQLLENYMDCGKANFCQVYINGAYTGVYTNCQDVGSSFLSSKFYSNNGVFIKGNPTVNPGPTTKCNLRYLPSLDSTGYFNYYEVKSNYGWNELVALCDTVTNHPASIGSAMDMDRWMWMLSFDNVLVNLDAYEGAFCQNYYLYKDNTHRFNPIIWDMNMSFGGFNFSGSGNTSLAQLNVSTMQQMPLSLHSTDIYWPVIKDVFSNPMYKRMYIAHARTIANEQFASGNYLTNAAHLQSIVDTAVQSDANNFFTYSQFQNGMTNNVNVGSTIVPGISTLMSSRNSYLQSTTEFLYFPPAITNITSSSTSPAINSTVTITAKISNCDSNAVYLGYRNAITDKFTRIRMYDDGLHSDGIANDSVYGASFTMSTTLAQYYIYAENTNAGMFSPERAEHEFYSLSSATIPVATTGQVMINEFMAKNTATVLNENGAYSDWIELFNSTSTTLSLDGLYLTDDFSLPAKYAFPPTAIIPANGYLIVWADQGATTAAHIHANFNLSGNGEALMLSNGVGIVFDSISYGAQTNDIAEGRCPDGTGAFGFRLPTFNASNCTAGIAENEDNNGNILIYPNPSNTIASVLFNSKEQENSIKLFNAYGQLILEKKTSEQLVNMDVSNLPAGVYFINVNNKYFRKVQVIK